MHSSNAFKEGRKPMKANAVQSITVEATIVRADGTRVSLGKVAESNKENVVAKLIKKLGGK